MPLTIKKAVKYDAKLRLALAGPSGSGKTFTALTLATALAGEKGVLVIDTERGSASKYADQFSFDVIELENYHPNNFIEGIHAAAENGYGCLIIDSLSHAWNGPGGLLEMVEMISKRSQSKNSFNAWGEATPLQNRLIDSITRAPLHIICTMRSKTEYVVEVNERGKSVPRKVGTAPVQRADVEYEFDVYADLDIENTLIVQKSRCPQLSGAVIAKPNAKVAETLKTWLSGAPAPEPAPVKDDAARQQTPAPASGNASAAPQARSNGTAQPVTIDPGDVPPSAAAIRHRVETEKPKNPASGQPMNYPSFLAFAFAKQIEAKKLTVSKLMQAGDELGPDYCKIMAATLHKLTEQAA